MPSVRINSNSNTGCYFITLTVKHWYYLFDRNNRWQILADAVQYCITHKQLTLYAFVFMLNHIHLIFYSPDASGFLRDFKKYTSKQLKKNIERTEPSVLKLFVDSEGLFEFWQKTNMPLFIEKQKFFEQKANYILMNPVRKQYVTKPEDWYWSSANTQCNLKVTPIV